MPQIGEVKKAYEVGKKGWNKYIFRACENCGKGQWVRWLDDKPASKICRKCASHYSNWKGDNITRDSGSSRAYRWYAPQICRLCGRKGERHHRDGNTLNNKPDNIERLCRKHHFEAHRFRARNEKGQFIKMQNA